MKPKVFACLLALMGAGTIAYADLTGGSGINEDGGVIAVAVITKSLDPEDDAVIAKSIRATITSAQGPSAFSPTVTVTPHQVDLPYNDQATAHILGDCVPGYYLLTGAHGWVDWTNQYHHEWNSWYMQTIGC